MDRGPKKVVIILAHPNLNESKANKTLAEAVDDPVDISVYNLYEMQKEITLEEWSVIMTNASALVFQFPFHWMSCPSLLKKWMDDVFTYLAETPAISGKPLMVVTTTGSSYDSYRSGGKNGFTVDELLRPFQGSAVFAGMIWKTPLVVYGMDSPDAGKNLSVGAELYKERINILKKRNLNNW